VKRVNSLIMKAQYTLFTFLFFVYFIIVSFALIPVAYVFGILDKISQIREDQDFNDKLFNNFLFIPFGIPILLFDTLADLYYFWANNFRDQSTMKVTIIPKEKTTISHDSIKEIMMTVKKFGSNSIKTVNTQVLVKVFNKHLNVLSNIQFLIFGQLIPIGGFKSDQ